MPISQEQLQNLQQAAQQIGQAQIALGAGSPAAQATGSPTGGSDVWGNSGNSLFSAETAQRARQHLLEQHRASRSTQTIRRWNANPEQAAYEQAISRGDTIDTWYARAKEESEAATQRYNDLSTQLSDLTAKKNSQDNGSLFGPVMAQARGEKVITQDDIDNLDKAVQQADAAQKAAEEQLRHATNYKAYQKADQNAQTIEDARERGLSYKKIADSYGQSLDALNEEKQEALEQLRKAQNGAGYYGAASTYEEDKKRQEEDVKSALARLEDLQRQIDNITGLHTQALYRRPYDTGADAVIKQGEQLAKVAREQGTETAEANRSVKKVADYFSFTPRYSMIQNIASMFGINLPEAYNPVSFIAELGIRAGENAPKTPSDDWTQEQLNVYHVLYGDPDYGKEAAEKFAQMVNYSIKTEKINEQKKPYYARGEDKGGTSGSKALKTIEGLIGAVPDMAFAAADYQDKLMDILATGQYAGHDKITTHEKFSAFSQGRAADLNRKTLSKEIPVIGGKGWGDIYQLGQSAIQSLASGHVLGEAATLGMFFFNAANSAFDEAMQRSGGNTKYATTYSLLSGAAEVIGEKVSLEHLLKGGKAGSLSFILKQAGIEGSEEVFTSLLNQFFDNVSASISGNQTAIQNQIDALVRQGMSYEDAQKQVWKETVSDLAWDFVGGAVSGGFSGMVEGAARGTRNQLWEMRKDDIAKNPAKQSDKSLDRAWENALKRGDLETARLIYEEMKRRNPGQKTAPQTPTGEQLQEGESFGKRVMDERSSKEPPLKDSVKGLFELENDNFQGAISTYSDTILRDAYEWALWNDEFTKANIIKEIADKRGISLEKQPVKQQPADEERPPAPESEFEPAAEEQPALPNPAESESRPAKERPYSQISPEAIARAQNLPDNVRQNLLSQFRAMQQELQNNPALANDSSFLQRLNDLFVSAKQAMDEHESRGKQQEATGQQEAPGGQITQPQTQETAGVVKPQDSEQASGTSTIATAEPLTDSTESGTISAPNTQEVTTNAGEQAVSGEEGEGGGTGVQRTPATDGRAADNAGDSESGQSGQRQNNREVPEGSGRDAEGAPADTVVSRSESDTRKERVPPKWVKLQRHIDAIKSGNWFGKRHNVKAGRNVLDPSYDPRGKLPPGANATSDFSSEIDQPDIGTVAHFMRDIMDVFGVRRGNGHIYTRGFDIIGDNGKPRTFIGQDGKLHNLRSKGCSSGSKVAVSVNQNGTLEQEMEGLINAAHECGHFRMQDKYGPATATVNVGKNGQITVGRRAEAAWRIAQNALLKSGVAKNADEVKVLLNSICDYWLDERGEGYKNIYINGNTYGYYAKYAGNDANLLQEMLRKHVIEEFLVESIAHSPALNNAVQNVSAIENAVMEAMFEDGVITQDQVNLLQEMREAMDNQDFIRPSQDVTRAQSGYYYSNVTESQDVEDIEHNEVARRSKRNVPVHGSEKAQFTYRLENTSEAQAESDFVSNRATKPKAKPKDTNVTTVEHDTVTKAANAILGQQLAFEGGKSNGLPDVIALDAKGTTYTVPDTVKASIKQIKKLVRGIAVGKHPMRSISELVDLYESFNAKDNDMRGFTTKEIQRSLKEIKDIASSRTMSDNQKIMALENATTKTLNLIAAQMNRVNMAFNGNLELAKTMSKLPKSQKLKDQGKIQNFIDKAFSWQANPTTLFKMFGGFNKTSDNVGYQFARKIQQGTIKYEVLYAQANQKFRELMDMDGIDDFVKNKNKVGVKLGNMELTEQQAIDFIKRVTTLEKTVISGQKRIDSIKGFAIEQKDGSYLYVDKKDVKQKWTKLRDQMFDSLSPVAKKYMEITSDVMHQLGQGVSDTKKGITGVGFWTMDKGVYYPLQYHSPSADTEIIEDNDLEYFGPTGESVTQQREREKGGYVIVRPASQTVDSYIDKACNYIAYGDMANQLYLMDNIGAGMTSLSNLVGINFGKDYARAVRNYINDLNNVKTNAPRAVDNLLKKGRSMLQRGALRFSVSVPLKQAPSYWTAMGSLSPEAVLKSWRMKAFLPSANYSKGDPMVEYRKIGGIDPTISEAMNDKSFISSLRSKAKIIEIWDNAITNIDVKAVDNLFKATIADTVLNYPEIPRDSKLFSDIVTAKFREVVLDTQPTYAKNARAEYQRTDDEIVRIVSMFRTQQTQNLNNIVTAVGEFRSAKGTIREAAMRQRLKGTIAGQVTSYIEFGILSALADMALHRKKKYKDDDDEWDAGKAAQRIGLNILESAAGTVWFGDEVTKMVVDAISKANKGDLNEFYGVSLGPVSTLTSVWDSFETFLSNRNASNLQKLVGNVAQVFGVPLGNAYRAVNSAVMWGLDLLHTADPTIGNRAGYDDILKMFDSYRKGTLADEGAKLQAGKAFRRGNTDNLLYELRVLKGNSEEGKNKGREWLDDHIKGNNEEERKAYMENERNELGRNLSTSERIARYLADSDLPADKLDKAIDDFAETSGYNILYESLRKAGMTPRAAVKELGSTDNKHGITTDIMDEENLADLYAGTDNPGTTNDVPALMESNTDEYVHYVSAMKVFKNTGNYKELDKLVDRYASLDENTRAVLEAKDSTLGKYRQYRAAGLSTRDYETVRSAIKDAQWELDADANTGSAVKLFGLSKTKLTDAQIQALIDNEAIDLSNTAQAALEVFSGYGWNKRDISMFLFNADSTNGESNGTLSNVEVAAQLARTPNLTDAQRSRIYEELKSRLSNYYNDWKNYSYESEVAYIQRKGLQLGKTA